MTVYLFQHRQSGSVVGTFSTAELAIKSLQYYAEISESDFDYDAYEIKEIELDHEWALPREDDKPILDPIPVCWSCRIDPSGNHTKFGIKPWKRLKPYPKAEIDMGYSWHMPYFQEGDAPCFVLGYGKDRESALITAWNLHNRLKERAMK